MNSSKMSFDQKLNQMETQHADQQLTIDELKNKISQLTQMFKTQQNNFEIDLMREIEKMT